MNPTPTHGTAEVIVGTRIIWDGRTVEPGTVLAGLPTRDAEALEHLDLGRVYRG